MRTQRIIKSNIEIFFPELSYEIVGILYKVHDDLGRFCRKRQYCDAIERMLKSKNISYQREVLLNKKEDNFPTNKADFVIENSMVLEIKAKTSIEKGDYSQIRRYLGHGGFKLGLLVNFKNKYIKPIRILNSEINS